MNAAHKQVLFDLLTCFEGQDSLCEGMNEWCIYIALFNVYCRTHKALYNHVGGVSPQPPPVCSIHLDDATAATGQRRQCAHHTPATGGEERDRANQVDRDY